MKYLFTTIFSLLVSMGMLAQSSFSKQETYNILRRVADWQIADFNAHQQHDDVDWTNAALYAGMADWAELSHQVDSYDTYYDWLLQIGRRNRFALGQNIYHADYIAVGQSYFALYNHYKIPEILWHMQARMDWIIKHPSEESMQLDESKPHTCDRWSWCDALFMAPPVWAQMYQLTGDKKF